MEDMEKAGGIKTTKKHLETAEVEQFNSSTTEASASTFLEPCHGATAVCQPVASTRRRGRCEEDDARGAALRDARGPDQRAQGHRCGAERAVVQEPYRGAGGWGESLVVSLDPWGIPKIHGF